MQLRTTWALVLVWPDDGGRLFHRQPTDELSSFRAVTGLEYDSVPPRSLNELPDQGIEDLIDLITLIEAKCEWPSLCNRIVFTAKAASGVRPIGLPVTIVRAVQASADRGQGVASLQRRWFLLGTHARGGRTDFPLKQVRMLVQLYQSTKHIKRTATGACIRDHSPPTVAAGAAARSACGASNRVSSTISRSNVGAGASEQSPSPQAHASWVRGPRSCTTPLPCKQGCRRAEQI